MILRWTGTDTLLLNKFPKGIRFRWKFKLLIFRLLMRVIEPHIQEHHVLSDLMKSHLIKFGFRKKISIVPVIVRYGKVQKIKHEKFNILYYFPAGKNSPKYHKWLYGWDIFQTVKQHYGKKVNWIIIDGSYDMNQIFPIVDFYLRCNRFDGYGRLREECKINNIPYYWSQENPDIFEIIKQIEGSM